MNVGTPAQPVKTLAQGMALAAAVTPRRNVRVSTAAHTIYEAMAVPGGVTVSGGYTPGAVWTRAGSNRTPLHRAMDLGGAPPVQDLIAVKLLPASSGSGSAGLEYFEITMDDVPAGNSPKNCIGVYMTAETSSSSERVSNCRITPGRGGSALPGNNGSNGTDGEDGANGGGANYWLGATGPFRGGDGANQGTPGNVNLAADPGADSYDGLGFTVAAGGAGGVNSAPVAGNGGDGQGNVHGAEGTHGLAGNDGTPGKSGMGGGGGGGGGGIGVLGTLSVASTRWGGGGAAGGRPGSPGTGGSGGKKGGHSIAIRINGTSFYTPPVLTNNILRPRDGGAGGNGGNGGLGGQGGQGGQGVIRPMDGSYKTGNGGNGGNGGDGGSGGGGGGGHGGNSFGIYATKIELFDSVVAPVTQSGNTFELGSGGGGGTGGLRGGSTTSRASNGNAGFAQNISTSP